MPSVAKVAYRPRSGSGGEKTFEDVIKGFDSDRHRVMLVVVELMKTPLVVASGSLPASLLLTFFPSPFLSPPFFFLKR